MKNCALAVMVVLMPLAMVHAQNSAPEAESIVDTIPAARDIPWPGVIHISVDASDNTRGIFRIAETIPVSAPGALTLLYPKWLPGHHSNNGPISQLAGLELKAGGKALSWRRDPVDVYAFHLEVPEGTSQIEADFQYLAPTDANQGRVVTTPEMVTLEWNAVVLYPAGYYVRQINVDASAKFPSDWKDASALEVASREGESVHFKPVSLDTLVDSPVFAGANLRVETLAPGVRLNIFADEPEQLAATEEQIQFHRNLVTQAVKLFGAQHYNQYDFLLELSEREGGIGLEHHRSSENGVKEGYFTKWEDNVSERTLLPHEYTHSWNGKFRRPADLWTPDYRTPMRDSLLWVYEGQTQFWGIVLAARSGLLSHQQALDTLAALAARLDTEAGRKWRPLSDTTDDPIIAQRRPKGWTSWQRAEDYYNEGALIWLDADSLIRQLSGGARSMDDFARAFFGVRDGDWGEMTYTFDDVVKTLNQVQTNDWAAFLHARLDNINVHAPLDGFTRGGYELIYSNTPSDTFKTNEKAHKVTDLSYSVGFVLDKDFAITEVGWDTPAFNAGLTVGTKLIALNGRSLETDQLKADIKAKKSPLKLLVKTGDFYRTIELNYDGGLRYPRLEKISSSPSSLDALLTPRN
ncbi:MAG TPA: peptidase M61 [Verrucomicrobiae bacterium]|jgi:predicted metalloprotease with PDZ domain|nr:peptidase M61 [Verrucomicrobiae bacterium]